VELKGNLANQSLSEKGFKSKEGAKHIFYQYYFEGKKTQIVTFMSRPPGPIYDKLISKMAKQVKLQRNEFIDLVNCPLTKEKLLEIYKERKMI
jgi:hypothetical protein